MSAELSATPTAPRRASLRFMFAHPAHLIALGFGSGLAPRAPGTAGTLWAWAAFALAGHAFGNAHWGVTLPLAGLAGWWACTRCAQHMASTDPGAIVWDEVIAFWLVLWLIAPAGLAEQLAAFVLFRFFDAVKPGPVGWADRAFKAQHGNAIGWAQGFGILFDDLVAAACTLALMFAGRAAWT